MSFIGETVATAKTALAGIWNGKVLPPFKKSEVMSRKRLSELAAVGTAVLAGRVVTGSTAGFFIGPGGMLIQVPDGTALPGSTGGGGGIVYCGLYSGSVDYSANDLVYTEPDSNTRYPWICELPNGPTTSAQAPTWPEPGTVYWRNLARNAGGSISMYRLKSVQEDYVTCRTWNGTTEGSSDIKIAKPYKLRNSITSETIFGVAHTYMYADVADTAFPAGEGNKQRTDNDGATDEIQMVIPVWLHNDLIFASAAATGVIVDGSDVGLIMQSDERKWAYLP